jgi:hypothetical protein
MNYLLEMKAFYDRLEVKPLSSSAIALWYALMHINNKTGWTEEFSVPVTVLSLKSGLSDRSLSNARNELKTKGYIDSKSRSGNRSAVYKINRLSAKFADSSSDSSSDTPSDSLSDSTSGSPSALYKQNKTKQKKDKDRFSNRTSEYTYEFEQFWSLYPRKVAKKRTWDLWRRRLQTSKPEGQATAEQMLQAAKNYATYCEENRTETQYIKHPSTFLSDKLDYQDWLEPVKEQTPNPAEQSRQKVFDMHKAIDTWIDAGFDPDRDKQAFKTWISKGANPNELKYLRATND